MKTSADVLLSSVEQMKQRHMAVCSGCSTCQPANFPAAAPSPRAFTEAVEAYEPRPYSPPAPKNPAMAESRDFLASYAGTWSFMLQLQAELEAGNLRFTDRVIEVVLNCKTREARWAKQREAEVAAPIVKQLPEGRRFYAVDNESGKVTFLRITRTKPTERFPRAMTFVDQVVGGGYIEAGTSVEPRARITPDGRYVGTFQALYEKVVSDPEAAMARFGHEIGRCGYCGRTLTDAESRARGIGPVCARSAGF